MLKLSFVFNGNFQLSTLRVAPDTCRAFLSVKQQNIFTPSQKKPFVEILLWAPLYHCQNLQSRGPADVCRRVMYNGFLWSRNDGCYCGNMTERVTVFAPLSQSTAVNGTRLRTLGTIHGGFCSTNDKSYKTILSLQKTSFGQVMHYLNQNSRRILSHFWELAAARFCSIKVAKI